MFVGLIFHNIVTHSSTVNSIYVFVNVFRHFSFANRYLFGCGSDRPKRNEQACEKMKRVALNERARRRRHKK